MNFGIDPSFFEIIQLVLVGDRANDAARIARCHHHIGNIVRDHAARTDDHTRADMHAGADDALRTDPYVIANGDANAVFVARVTDFGMNGVTGGVNTHAGGKEAVVSDGDLGNVQNGAVEIGKKVFAHENVLAVIAVKGRIDHGRFIRAAKQLRNRLANGIVIGVIRLVERVQKQACLLHLCCGILVKHVEHFCISSFYVIHK